MTIPGVLFWKESLLFIIAISLFANIETSFAAFLSSKKKKEVRKSRLLYKEVTMMKRKRHEKTVSNVRIPQ